MQDYEYFELKYLEEIFQLFRECQEISKYNNLDLLLRVDDNFMDIFDFIFNSMELNEIDEVSEEENEDINIY
jgi:hypothetical protein|tara:strand:+ start:2006 stop:2221 length:216 start_codon:yes stop_codon:yes gene_type:complete